MRTADPTRHRAALLRAERHLHAGNLVSARSECLRILDVDKNYLPAVDMLGKIAFHTGNIREAARHFLTVARLLPDAFQGHLNLGLANQALGRVDEALANFKSALRCAPHIADTHNHLANALRSCGRAVEAVDCYRNAIRLAPRFVEYHANLGGVLLDLGQPVEAKKVFLTALNCDPGHVRSRVGLGIALGEQDQLDGAESSLEVAFRLAPNSPEVLTNLGTIRSRKGRPAEAIDLHQRALNLRPDYPQALINLGHAYLGVGRVQEAYDACCQAITLAPRNADAHHGLGRTLQSLYRWEDAAAEFGEAVKLNPRHLRALGSQGVSYQLLGRLKDAMQCFERILEIDREHEVARRAVLNCSLYREDIDADSLKLLHLEYGAVFSRPLPDIATSIADARTRQLRIGYLSSDLREHPVAGNMLPVIRAHNRAAFAIYFYSAGTRPDTTTEDFRALADGWRDVAGLSDEDIARQIRSDGIDILVCLAGRFDENRLGVCGYRAAPVQISLHDVATSGLTEMDYIIGDRWLFPYGDKEYFTERRLRLPHFYVSDLPAELPPPSQTPRRGPPVFCCFNNPAKINPMALELWGRILAALPEARLILKYMGSYASPELCRRFLTIITAAGGTSEQVTFVASRDDAWQFLDRYNAVDIALDTFPFSGSTTSFQALAMGVPVVTWPWDRMVSRWTAAMLHPLRLEELITGSAENYVATAVAAGRNVEHWRSRRSDIQTRLAKSELCRSPRWTRHLERYYRAVWCRKVAEVRGE